MSELWLQDNDFFYISQLSHKLKSEFLNEVNKNLGLQLSKYKPWMSAGKLVSKLSDNSSFIKYNEQIVTDPKILNYLKNCFYESPERPFGLIDNKNTPFQIATSRNYNLDKFDSLTKKALDLILHSEIKKAATEVIHEIIPLEAGTTPLRKMGAGRSSHWYIGGVFIGLPEPFVTDYIEHAINISHEVGHQVFMILQYADKILEDPYDTPIYSAVRKTERPAIMSFHALIALFFMSKFLMSISKYTLNLNSIELDYVNKRLDEVQSDINLGILSFLKINFTPFGHTLFHEIKTQFKVTQK